MTGKWYKPLTRSPSVLDTVSFLIPSGHAKPLKQALYTSGTLAVLALFVVISTYAYFVLKVFIKPLLWALLCGSFLFPFKHALHKLLERYLEKILQKDRLLFVEFSATPFYLFSGLSDFLGLWVIRHSYTILLFLAVSMMFYALYFFQLLSTICSLGVLCAQFAIDYFTEFLNLLERPSLLFLASIFFLVHALLIDVVLLKYVSGMSLWLTALSFCCQIHPSLKLPVVGLFCILFCIGIFSSSKRPEVESRPSTSESPTFEPLKGLFLWIGKPNKYFRILFGFFLVTLLMQDISLILILFVPLMFFLLKRMIFHDFTRSLVDGFFRKVFGFPVCLLRNKVLTFVQQNQELLFPLPMQWFCCKVRNGDRTLIKLILSRLPTITSACIILFIFTQTLFGLVFLFVRIQHESIYGVQIASQVINQTVQQHPELKTWLPNDPFVQKALDSFVDNTYLHGRTFISSQFHANVPEHSNFHKLKNDTLLLWDKLYQGWFGSEPVKKDGFYQSLMFQPNKKQKEDHAYAINLLHSVSSADLLGWLQQNLSSFITFGESLWSVMQSNISIFASILSTIISALFQGGTFVLNFLVYLLIFFTTLFYLLSTSVDQYKPLEILGSFVQPITTNLRLENVVQDAVNGVFGASIKMFCFYGIFTWVNHSLFGSEIVYIPAVLAATFGVVPLITTYWVCVPSFFELWLFKGSLIRAIGLLVFQVMPTFFVDAAIYGEIGKECHPYLTGLAVAGGMYKYGLEGAIFGPLILCFLLVVTNLYSSSLKECIAPEEESYGDTFDNSEKNYHPNDGKNYLNDDSSRTS